MSGRKRLVLITLLLVFSVSTPVNATTVGFRPPVDYPAGGNNPVAVSIADFNGDGKNDVAVANHGDPTAQDDGGVSILLGNGDGTFQAATNLVVSKNPCCVGSGDFNGDGKLDLGVLNTDSTLSVLLGNGDGTFAPHVDYPTGPGTGYSLRLGDVNGDQVVDLIMLRSGSFGILIGNGDGTFQNPVDVGTGSYPEGLSVFDVDGDGKLDLVTTVGSSGVETLLGNGDGTFQAPILCSCGTEGPMLYAQAPTEGSDFNEDGHMDLAIRLFFNDLQHNSFYAEEAVLFGNGDGTFQPNGHFVHTSGPAALIAGVADFSRDGHSDLAIAFDSLNVLFGNGRGSFTRATFNSGLTNSIATGDISGDDFPDVIVTNYGLNAIRVLINTAQPVPVLTVTLAGNGSGNVTSNPAGIECPGTCLWPFDVGTVVSLTATESNGSTFSGWSGACSGTGACNVTMDTDQTVTATFTTPDFSMSASAAAPNPISPGQSSSASVDIGAVNGFNGSVSLVCSVQPAPAQKPQCSVNPASIAPGTPATLTVTTTAPTMALASPSTRSSPFYAMWLPVFGFALAGIGIGSRRERKAKWLGFTLCSLLFAGLLFQAACGGGSSTDGGGSSGTPKGQYTITISGTSGSLQHSTQVTLTLQ
jgi:hypothetical protein